MAWVSSLRNVRGSPSRPTDDDEVIVKAGLLVDSANGGPGCSLPGCISETTLQDYASLIQNSYNATDSRSQLPAGQLRPGWGEM